LFLAPAIVTPAASSSGVENSDWMDDAKHAARCSYCYASSKPPEALKPVNHPTSLTAPDPFGTLLESRELAAGADLPSELLDELQRRHAAGQSRSRPATH
jgi:hypothetical protein